MSRKWLFCLFLVAWFFFWPPILAVADITFYKPTQAFVVGATRFKSEWFNCKHGKTRLHVGIDVDYGKDSEVYSAASGLIKYAGVFQRDNPRLWGDCVILEHQGKITTLYGHIRIKPGIVPGKQVGEHQLLGWIDQNITGATPHLHFGIRFAPYNPDLSKRGALPASCKKCGDPLFPEHFQDPLKFLRDWPAKPLPLDFLADRSAIAIVIDKSGSMKWQDKFTHASRGVDSLIDVARTYDSISLAQFGYQGKPLIGLTRIGDSGARERLKRAKGGIGPDENTNIGGGLSVALSQLRKASAKEHRAVILLSDGIHNYGELWPVVDRVVKSGIPIYTIAYGRDADRNTLIKIARMTGGTFLNADTTNVTQAYQKLSAHARLGSVLISYNDSIEQGSTLSYLVDVAKDFVSVIFTCDWQGSRIEMKLVSPSGKAITPQNWRDRSGVRYVESPTYSLYVVDRPEAGKWQTELFGAKIPRKEQINLTVSGTSPVMFNSLMTSPYYPYNPYTPTKVLISAKVAEIVDGQTEQLKKVEVIAWIHKPEPSLIGRDSRSGRIGLNLGGLIQKAISGEKKIHLYDDGRNGDGQANDGVFTAVYDDADLLGPYAVDIRCIAQTKNGQQIDRLIRESFQVGDLRTSPFSLSRLIDALR